MLMEIRCGLTGIMARPIKMTRQLHLLSTETGNVYVTGRSTGTGTGYDFATIKYNATGAQLWVARYNGPGSGSDGPGIFIGFLTSHPLAVDASGQRICNRNEHRRGIDFDYTTIKYAQTAIACGDKGNKVLVCHKGKTTLCISKAAVSNHLNHGDQLGACALGDNNARTDRSSSI